MDVNGPYLDAFESAAPAQIQAREFVKINGEAFIPNLQPNAPVLESMGISSHDNAPRESQWCSSSHEQSDSDESQEHLEKSTEWIFLEKSTEWIFQGYLFFCSDGWRTDEAYVAEVRAVVEQQYLPKVPVWAVSVQHMAIFYDSVASITLSVIEPTVPAGSCQVTVWWSA